MIKELPSILLHPKEWKSLFEMRKKFRAYRPDNRPLNELAYSLTDTEFCYAALSKVSRSFSVVIRRLPEDLRDVVCVFYLVLRGLDSIEDDTTIDRDIRIVLLKNFYGFLDDPEWKTSVIGTNGDYNTLLAHFQKVTAIYRRLDARYQRIIQRICRQMGEGMALLLDKELRDVQEYDDYCYYVAGLVGVGLSELFVASSLENRSLTAQVELQIAMGQFLQKTNIIRDFREDLDEERSFWPREIWNEYSHNMEDLCTTGSQESIYCLNHMVSDALRLAPKCLEYLRLIEDPQIFQFCAIPQVMAMATLAQIFNNPEVFQRNVKIRKGLGATLFMNTTRYSDAHETFHTMAEIIFDKLSISDPNLQLHVTHLQKICGVSDPLRIYTSQRNGVWEDPGSKELNLQVPVYTSGTQ